MYDYSDYPQFEPGSFAWARDRLEENEALSEAEVTLVLEKNYGSAMPGWLDDYIVIHRNRPVARGRGRPRNTDYTIRFLGHGERAYEKFHEEELALEAERRGRRRVGRAGEPACIRAARRVVAAMVEAERMKAVISPERFLNLISEWRGSADTRSFVGRLNDLRKRYETAEI